MKKKIEELEQESEQLRQKYFNAEERGDTGEVEEYYQKYQLKSREIRYLETDDIKATAKKLGIYIPRDKGMFWTEPNLEQYDDAPEMLTDLGRGVALGLIKTEERAIHDANVKKKSQTISFLALIVALLSTVVAIVAIFNSGNQKNDIPFCVQSDGSVHVIRGD